ncbi:MAG: ArsR family transcriptional regulator [Nitrospirae bacterium]|nr:ArsR family transcriptional regulator [Nitrospirota bacterium]MCL5238463.1 ArsR family transcriptional regulator [Nitrospirota bacterium]
MGVRDIKISIKSDEELFEEVKSVVRKIERGEKVKKHEGISFEDMDTLRKVLTDERIRILKTIKKEHPQSIYELARMLHRDIKNTFDDVKFLAEMGLVDLKKTKNGREKTTPTVNYDRILLEIPVS